MQDPGWLLSVLENSVQLPSSRHDFWWEICCHSDIFPHHSKVLFSLFSKFFYLSLVFRSLIVTCHSVDFFGFIVFEIHSPSWILFLFCFVFKDLFIYFMAALGLHCCARAFYSCGEWGLLSSCSEWERLIAVISIVLEHGLQGAWASVVAAPGPSCPTACGIFPDQGLNLLLFK